MISSIDKDSISVFIPTTEPFSKKETFVFSTSPQLATIVVLFSVSLFTACVGPAMMNRGTKYLNEGQYDMAISDFTIALQKDPNDAAIWNLRGVAYYKKAQFDKVICAV